MEPVFGNHLGMVVNNQDPEGRKRVQVFIPYLSNTLFSKWNTDLKDIKFKNTVELDEKYGVLSRLKQTLPWAEAAAPIFGGATSMTSNSVTRRVGVNNSTPTYADYGLFGAPEPAASVPNDSTTPLTGYKSGEYSPSGTSPTISQKSYATIYSFATAIGGPDKSSDDERLTGQTTNTGYGNQGKQNLGPGALAVPAGSVFKSGDILVNERGEIGMVVDRSGNKDVTNVDVWTDPYKYVDTDQYLTWSKIDNKSTPKTNEELQSLLSGYNYTISGGGAGPSAAAYISAGKNGMIASAESVGVTPTVDVATNKSDTNVIDPNDAKNVASASANAYTSASGSPNGAISIPNEGAKVWVFFYGGDIQKPVYFASAIEGST